MTLENNLHALKIKKISTIKDRCKICECPILRTIEAKVFKLHEPLFLVKDECSCISRSVNIKSLNEGHIPIMMANWHEEEIL